MAVSGALVFHKHNLFYSKTLLNISYMSLPLCVLPGEYCPSVPAPNSWYMSDKACHFISPLLNSSFHLNWTAAQAYCSNLVPNRNCQLLSLYDVYTKVCSRYYPLHRYFPSSPLIPINASLIELSVLEHSCIYIVRK